MKKKLKKALLGDDLKPKPLSSSIQNSSRLSQDPMINAFNTIGQQQVNKAVGDQMSSLIPGAPGGGMNWGGLIPQAASLINSLIPGDRPDRWKTVQPLEIYNPFPNGTGSQAIAKQGTTMQAPDGGEINPYDALATKKYGFPYSKLTFEQKLGIQQLAGKQALTTNPLPKQAYEPSGRLKDTKAALALATVAPGVGPFAGWVGAGADLATSINYAMDGQYENATQDLLSAGLDMIPYAGKINKFTKSVNGLLKSGKTAANAATIKESFKKGGTLKADEGMGIDPLKPVNPDYKFRFTKNYDTDLDLMTDSMGYSLSNGLKNPLKDKTGRMMMNSSHPLKQKLMDSVIAFNSFNNAPGENSINDYYNSVSQDPEVQEFKRMMMGRTSNDPLSSYRKSPLVTGTQATRDMLTKLKNGGNIGNPLSIENHTPISEDTTMITGDSHADGGTMVQYGGNTIEAERGEPLSIHNDGTATIWGNLKVPGTKEKFKSVVKKVGQKEAKYDKLQVKAIDLLTTSNENSKFGKLALNSAKIMNEGAEMAKQDLSQKKDALAMIQSVLLAEKPMKAKNGAILAKNGYSSGDPIKDIIAAIGKVESGSNYSSKSDKSSATGKYQMVSALRKDLYNKYFKAGGDYSSFEDFDKSFKTNGNIQEAAMLYRAKELNQKYNGDISRIVLAHRLGEGGEAQARKDPSILNKPISVSFPGSTDKETPNEYLKKVMPSYNPKRPTPQITATPNTDIPLTKRNLKLPDIPLNYTNPPTATPNNPIAPPLGEIKRPIDRNMPSNIEGLNAAQYIPELYAFGKNQVEPVPLQQVNPDLFSPYQVSFQDRINDNSSTFQALTRQVSGNPAILQGLAANKYAADSQVGAEEFRTNQSIYNDIINRNTALLNDSQMKNLALADQQYVRQQGARDNTESQNELILNSLSSKELQNNYENKRLAAYENLYNFRLVDSNNDGTPDKAKYFGPDASFGGFPSNSGDQFSRTATSYDGSGSVQKTTVTTPSAAQIEEQRLKTQKLKSTTPAFSWRKFMP